MADTSTGLAALGINWPSLLFQLINFGILFWLLKRYAYQPILKVLADRRAAIEESLRSAKTIEATRRTLEEEGRRAVGEARRQAQEIVEQSRQQAADIVARAEEQAAEKADDLLRQAQARITQEMSTARQELRQETAGLVVLATEKILRRKLDAKADHALVRQAIEDMSTSR
jgi:F-type H+-transporting ATPase subunit b